MPQQLANLLLPAPRPDIQPSAREVQKDLSQPERGENSFTRTLDRQLDRQTPKNHVDENRSTDNETAAIDTPAPRDELPGETAAGINSNSDDDTASPEATGPNPLLINAAVVSKTEIAKPAQIVGRPGSLTNLAGLPGQEEISPDSTLSKPSATGVLAGQKTNVQTPSSDLFAKELGLLNLEQGGKLSLEEAKALSANNTGQTKGGKATGNLLQQALSEISGIQNQAQKNPGNAAANFNGNAALPGTAEIAGASTEISQSTEELSLTPQNSHNISTRFGTAIQSNQSAQTAVNTLALQIAKHASQGVNRFQIRMDPPEMGRIDVKLEFAQDGRMTANMSVERPETLDLLLRDARALERALAGSGLNTDKNSLNFSLKDQSDSESAEYSQDRDSATDTSSASEDESEVSATLNNTLAAYQNLISNTAVDIRI